MRRLFVSLIVLFLCEIASSKVFQRTFGLKSHHKNITKKTKIGDIPALEIVPSLAAPNAFKPDPEQSKYKPCEVVGRCMNGGSCVPVGSSFFCNCAPSFYGTTCEFVADDSHCLWNECQNNATCYSLDRPRLVAPPLERTLNDSVGPSLNASLGNIDAPVEGTIISVNYGCWCRGGFYGDFCEYSADLRACSEDQCNYHGASVLSSGGNCSCVCDMFFEGDECSVISPCIDMFCYNGGNCSDTDDTARCNCPGADEIALFNDTRISGEQCEKVDLPHPPSNDSCDPTPCQGNFTAFVECLLSKTQLPLSVLGHWWGNCTWGNWSCYDFLNETDCFNNGTCNGIVDRLPYTDTAWDGKLFLLPKCECAEGFEGNFCERSIPDPCAEVNGTKKCGENGTCVPNNGTHSEEFTCICNAGYEGIYCERWDPCYNRSCEEGLCVPVPIGELEKDVTATCLCNLNQDVDSDSYNCTNPFYAQCRNASIPGGLNCRNGAHCYPCGLNTTGTGIDLCNDEERGRGFRCICPLGFAPPFCDAPYTACTEHQCQNGATCVLVNSTANSTVDDDDVGYRCDCPPLYNGTFCENKPDACTLHASYCVNGQCVLDPDWHQGFRCDCAQGFTGFRCDLAVKAGFIVSFQARYEWTYPLATMLLLIPFVVVVVAYNEVTYRAMRKPEAHTTAEDGPPDPAKEVPCDTGGTLPLEPTPPESLPPVPTTPEDTAGPAASPFATY